MDNFTNREKGLSLNNIIIFTIIFIIIVLFFMHYTLDIL